MPTGLTIFFVLALIGTGSSAAAQQIDGNKTKTVWDGAYTAEQALRGQGTYSRGCGSCHGENFLGVAGTNAAVLIGDRFLDRWREDDLGELFRFLQTSMPSREATSMTDAAKLDVMAYLLKANNFPPGSAELTATTVTNIQLVGKDGPKPVPSMMPVRAVGCLTQAPGNVWTLTRVAEPSRTRVTDETTPEELKSSESRPAGSLTFKLPSLDFAIPGVKPSTLKGHRVQVKGVVYRQPGNDRINVLSLVSLARVCEQ